ncbi:MAG: hypothetical protein NTX50_19535 [Candidatus Sumerlaeota bacterium]|nr:hypothetical protein [Candidatus Sumerlaeota bacterium]
MEVLLRLLAKADALGNAAIRNKLGLKDCTHLRHRYIAPALAGELIEPTIPDGCNPEFRSYFPPKVSMPPPGLVPVEQ